MLSFGTGVTSSVALLTSNLNKDNIAYDEQTVIFRCTIRGTGTLVLTWISNDYIGDNWLQFSSVHNPGGTETSPINPATVATLISATTESVTEVTEIISELRIVASVQRPNSSVACQVNGIGVSNTTMFRKADV